MGVIGDLFENDKDGSLRRHVFRTISTIGYVLVVAVILLLAGLIWRMFTGAEVEIFGLRVAQPERVESEERKPPPPAPALTVPTPPAATTVPPPVPPPSGTAITQPFQHGTLWPVVPGDFEDCVRVMTEALNKSQLSVVTRTASGLSAVKRKDGERQADVYVRCMPLNGMTVASTVALSTSIAVNSDILDTIFRETSLITKGPVIDRMVGTVDKVSEQYWWVPTTITELEACKAFTQQVLQDQNPAWRRQDGNGVFGRVENARVTLICLPEGKTFMVLIATKSFWRDEAIRVRDQFVRAVSTRQRS